MPYHPLGLNKAEKIGRALVSQNPGFPSVEEKHRWKAIIQEKTDHEVVMK